MNGGLYVVELAGQAMARPVGPYRYSKYKFWLAWESSCLYLQTDLIIHKFFSHSHRPCHRLLSSEVLHKA